MAEYTTTYTNVIQRWAAFCGLKYADLQTTEADLFKQYANARLRYIWDYAEWPETIQSAEETLTDQAFTADTDINYILGVFEYDPFTTFSTRNTEYRFQRKQDSVYVSGSDVPETVYVVYKERYPAFATGADTIPTRFAEYVATGAYADWLRAEMDESANRMDQVAEELLFRELDKFERQEKHAQWGSGFRPQAAPVY